MVAAFRGHQVGMLARQAAYSLLYALPAMIALLVFLAAVVDRYTNTGLSTALQEEIDTRAPAELQPLLESLVQHAIAEQDGSTAAIGAVVAFAVALWGGAGGAGALIYACNRVFDVTDTRSYVAGKLLALALTLAGGAMVIVAFVLILIGERVESWIEDRQGWSFSLIDLLLASRLGPATLVFLAVTLLYLLAPDVPLSPQWVVPGAILASLATLLAFAGFDLVIGIIDPGSAFGAAGSVLVLLWLLDLVSMFVVSGAIINSVLSERFDARLIAWLNGHPERRLPPRV